MGIIGERPESGVRLAVTRVAGSDSTYSGEVATPSERVPVQIEIGEGDAVEIAAVGPVPSLDDGLRERVRLLVRSVVRHARADGRPLPRSIQRWRP